MLCFFKLHIFACYYHDCSEDMHVLGSTVGVTISYRYDKNTCKICIIHSMYVAYNIQNMHCNICNILSILKEHMDTNSLYLL